MVIEETDFRMTSVGDKSNFWDLELLQTVRPKGGPERQEFKEAGYGLPFLSCMKRIASHRIANKKEVFTLKEYVQDYKQQIDKLEELSKSM